MQADREVVTLQDFSMLSQLGIGNYAKVILVRKKNSGKVYAMKIIKKSREHGEIKGLKKQHAFIEKEILVSSDHPFVVRLYSTFQKQKKLYFVMEYCPGGQLFGLIRRLKRLSEESVKFYAAQILVALQYIHSRHFIYRDLKPQNVLIDQQGYVRLIDFGLSCRDYQMEGVESIAGTPEYLPPEVFGKGVNVSPAVDWWAFGNIIFEMIAGFPPFFVQHQKFAVIKNKICNDEPPLYFITNPLLKDLIQRLLNKNPKQRFGIRGADEIKRHDWFYGTNWQGLIEKKVEPPFKPEIKNDADTHWFQNQQKEMSPPQSSSYSQKSGTQKYQEFSSSWKSSRELEGIEQAASPPEVFINMSELSPK